LIEAKSIVKQVQIGMLNEKIKILPCSLGLRAGSFKYKCRVKLGNSIKGSILEVFKDI